MTGEYITSRKNPLIQQVRKLLSSRKAREEAGLFVGDGTKLLEEAVRYCPGLKTVILSGDVQARVPDSVRLVRVSEDVMESVSPMATPQGALFLCELPPERSFAPRGGMLLLDGIQDALDIPVALLEGCADPFSHKVVRSSMGAVFRREVVRTSWEQVCSACREKGIPIGVTALSARAGDIRRSALGTMAVVIGSEGQGVRQEILRAADAELIIPMNPHCESLNAAVAATIVMWEMARG